jgi:hypothetical protein
MEENEQIQPEQTSLTPAPPQPPDPPINKLVQGVRKRYYPHKSDQEVAAAVYGDRDKYHKTLDKIYSDDFEAKGVSRADFIAQVESKYGNPFPEPVVKKKAGSTASSSGSKPSLPEQPAPTGLVLPSMDQLLSDYDGNKTAKQDATKVNPDDVMHWSDELERQRQDQEEQIKQKVEAPYLKQGYWGGVKLGSKFALSKLAKGGVEGMRGLVYALSSIDKKLGLSSPGHVETGQAIANNIFDELDKKANMDLPEAYEPDKVLGAVGGILKIVPAMLASESTAGSSYFFQGTGAADKQVEDLKKQGVKFQNHTDDLYKVGYGVMNYLLMNKLNSHTLISKMPSGFRNNIIGNLVADGIKSLADKGGNATAEDVMQAFVKPALNFSQRVKQLGLDAVKSYGMTAADLTAFSTADYGLKAAVNTANDQEPFKQNIGELGDNIKNILSAEAPAFAFLGLGQKLISQPGLLFDKSPYKNTLVSDLQQDSSPENVDRIKKTMVDIAQAKSWTEKELNDTVGTVDLMADAASKLPSDLPANRFYDGVNLVMGRRQLEDVQRYTEENKGKLDPAIAGKATAFEALVKAKIEQANDKLSEIVTGKPFDYFEKDGKYFRQVPGEQLDEISKDRYELEHAENPNRTRNESKGINEAPAEAAAPAPEPKPKEPTPSPAAEPVAQEESIDDAFDRLKVSEEPKRTYDLGKYYGEDGSEYIIRSGDDEQGYVVQKRSDKNMPSISIPLDELKKVNLSANKPINITPKDEPRIENNAPAPEVPAAVPQPAEKEEVSNGKAVDEPVIDSNPKTVLKTKAGEEPLSKPPKPIKPVDSPEASQTQKQEPQAPASVVSDEEPTLTKTEAETNRETGTYTRDNVEYKRNPEQDFTYGEQAMTEFASGVNVPTRYALMEADELQPSHMQRSRNPMHFIPEAQPKNRTDEASYNRALEISNKPDFDKISSAPNPYTGAPVVNKRGEVIQGNNRAEGIKLYHDAGKNNDYKINLIKNLDKFGLPFNELARYKKPVLVRVAAVDDNTAINLGNYDVKDIETGGKRRVDARATAARIPIEDKQKIIDRLFSGQGDKSLNQIVRDNFSSIVKLLAPKYINETQLNNIINVNTGTITKDGIQDLEGLFRQFLFEGADSQLADKFQTLSGPVQAGIEKSIPKLLTGARSKSLLPEVQGAITALYSFNKSGIENFSSWANQGDAFNGAPALQYSSTELAIAGMLEAATTQKQVMEPFSRYAMLIRDQPGNMFNTNGTKGMSKEDAVRSVFGVTHEPTLADNINSLTDDEKEIANAELAEEGLTLNDIENYGKQIERKQTTESNAQNLQQSQNDGAGYEKPVGGNQEGKGKTEQITSNKTVNLKGKDYTDIGKNTTGEAIYENEDGIRAIEGSPGIFSIEPVLLIPTPSGIEFNASRNSDQYLTDSEIAETAKKEMPVSNEPIEQPEISTDGEVNQNAIIKNSVEGDASLKEGRQLDPERNFIDSIRDSIQAKTKLNIVSMRKLAEEYGMVRYDDVKLQDLAETAVVEIARGIALYPELNDLQKLNEIEALYENQPSFNQRSSERIEKQQYSTPAPTSFIANLYGRAINPARIFEPSAGNGLLVLGFDPRKVWANEIDKNRLANLQRQGYMRVSDQDATHPFGAAKIMDFVATNPPFGKSPERIYDGYRISGLDEQMIINALNELKDTGRAALIMGGHNKYDAAGRLASDRVFFNYLYSHYNVSDVINMDGALYQKQGTTFPTRLILINGRKAAVNGVSPLRDDVANKPVTSFRELFDRVQSKILNDENRNLLQPEVDAERNAKPVVYGKDTFVGEPEPTPAITPVPEGKVSPIDRGVGELGRERPEPGGGPDRSNDLPDKPRGNSGRTPTDGQLPTLSGDDVTTGKGSDKQAAGDNAARSTASVRPDRPVQTAGELADQLVTSEKVSYSPTSASKAVGSVIPSNMATEATRVLKNIENEHGNIDVFVSSRLGYGSLDDMYKAFSAEQVDALAMGIAQMENGQGMIVGDMTGVGKGRIAAGMVRYGIKNGRMPIFLTEKATLFSDLYRDMVDIGSPEYVPFIINDKSSDNDPTITDANGNVVHKVPPAPVKNVAMNTGEMPNGYDFVMATYSQFTSSKPSNKKSFLQMISSGNPMIMDESHNVSGTSNSGEFFQDVLQNVQGVVYLSATFAKRPDNMPVYALKTSMSEANMSKEELVDAIRKGGVALQEIVSSQLVESGQMLRRERDFTGVKSTFIELKGLAKEHRAVADQITDIVRDIIDFQRSHVNDVISTMDEKAAESGQMVTGRKGTQAMGVSNTPFASKVFNVIDQMLFAIKADSVADAAIDILKSDRKAVIAFKSTMESFLKNSDLQVGDTLKDPNFAMSLMRGLKSVMRYTSINEMGDKVPGELSVDELAPEGAMAYHNIADKIQKATANISVSPIDRIIKKISDAGFTVGEITGRKMQLSYNEDGSATVKAREDRDIKRLVRSFNNGEGVDVILLNASGATGLSMHASEKFKDQRQRVMITHQLELDINKEIQKRGRTDRSGQVKRGEYMYMVSSIPAESRLLMMAQSKLKSLDANTTSSQKGKNNQVDVTDFLNKYGDKVVIGYLKEHPDLNEALLDPFGMQEMDSEKLNRFDTMEGAAQKVTGRVAILPSDQQETFYNDIMGRYADLIQYLEDTNGNDLEVKSLPLDAETISQKPFIIGKGGISPFGRDSIMEKIESNIIKKPYSKEQLEREIAENLDGVTPSQQEKVRLNSLSQYYEHRINEMKAYLKTKYADQRKEAGDNIGDDVDKLSEKLQVINQAEQADIEAKVGQLEMAHHNIERVLGSFRTGEEYDVPNVISKSGNTYSRGVFLGFDFGKSTLNPFSPSNIKMRFAVLDGRRVVAVPLSQTDFVNAALEGKQQAKMAVKSLRADWGSVESDKAREIRYMITGNILQAYNDNGQLVAYTTREGQLKKGILMPKGFEPESNIVVPATRALKSILALPKYSEMTTTDGAIQIRRVSANRFEIAVPAAKSTGGMYFLDADLRSVVESNNFNTSRGLMVAEFTQDQMPKMLNILQNKFGKSFKVDDAGDAEGANAGPEQNSKDYIFDQSNVKPVLDFLDGLKIKAGKIFSTIVPIPPAVFNKAIDILKSIVKVTNSAQKAVRVAVRYLKSNGASKSQVSAFVHSMQAFFESNPAVKKVLEAQEKNEDLRSNLNTTINTTLAEAEQTIQTGLTDMEVREYRTKLTGILSEARKLNMIKYGEADSNKANAAILAVNQISYKEPGSVKRALEAINNLFNNVEDKADLKLAKAARTQLRTFVTKKETVLPGTMLRDLVNISPDTLDSATLKDYKEIVGTLVEQLNGNLPGLIPNEDIAAFSAKVKLQQEGKLKERLVKQYAQFGASDAMSIEELMDMDDAAKVMAQDDQDEPVAVVNKKRAVLDMFIDDAKSQIKMDEVNPEYRGDVAALLKLSTDKLSTGEMKLFNQVLNNIAINNNYAGMRVFSTYQQADQALEDFKTFAAPYQDQFRQISFGQAGKDLYKGSMEGKLSLTDKFFHLNSEREVGTKLDSIMAFPINQGYQRQQQEKAAITEGFRAIRAKHNLNRESMFRIGVVADLSQFDLTLGTDRAQQFSDGLNRLAQAVERLRPFQTKHERTMFAMIDDIYKQVKSAQNPEDLQHLLSPGETELYGYTQNTWGNLYPRLKENNELHSFDPLGEIEAYSHRKYYNVGGKIDVNLVDDAGIDVKYGSTTREAKTKLARTVRDTLPAGKVIDYNIFNSFNKGVTETLNDIHTLGVRIKANRMLTSKDLPAVIDMTDRFKKTNTEILTNGIKLMVNVQRGVAKSDADLYGSGSKITNWVRQAFYTATTGNVLAGIPQYASSVAFVLPQLENPSTFWKSLKMFTVERYSDPEMLTMAKDLMNKVGGGTIIRDLQGDQQLTDQLNNAAETLFGKYTNENLSEMVQWLQDKYFYSLKLGDRSISMHSWMAGYINSLIKQGVIGKSSEFTKDFLRTHLDNPNQMAATEAEALVTISNNESDSSRRPEMFVNKTQRQEFLNDILYPLKKFAVSMYNKMMLGVRNISEQNGGEIDGAKLIIGAIASSVIFNVISQFVVSKAYDEAGDLVMKAVGSYDDEQAMLDRKGITREEVERQQFEQKKLNLITSTAADLFLNGHNVVVENGVKSVSNLIYQGITDGSAAKKTGETDEWGKPVKAEGAYMPKQLFYTGNNPSEMMGIYSNTPVGMLFDIPTDKHNPYNVLHEQFKYHGWEGLESKRLLFALGIPTLTATGLLPADVNRVNTRVRKRMEKLYEIEKEFNLKYFNKDNPDYQQLKEDYGKPQ